MARCRSFSGASAAPGGIRQAETSTGCADAGVTCIVAVMPSRHVTTWTTILRLDCAPSPSPPCETEVHLMCAFEDEAPRPFLCPSGRRISPFRGERADCARTASLSTSSDQLRSGARSRASMNTLLERLARRPFRESLSASAASRREWPAPTSAAMRASAFVRPSSRSASIGLCSCSCSGSTTRTSAVGSANESRSIPSEQSAGRIGIALQQQRQPSARPRQRDRSAGAAPSTPPRAAAMSRSSSGWCWGEAARSSLLAVDNPSPMAHSAAAFHEHDAAAIVDHHGAAIEPGAAPRAASLLRPRGGEPQRDGHRARGVPAERGQELELARLEPAAGQRALHA